MQLQKKSDEKLWKQLRRTTLINLPAFTNNMSEVKQNKNQIFP
jgi:hypothetical protein